MRRLAVVVVAVTSALLLGPFPVHADRLRVGFAFDYGTTSSSFGLSSSQFTVPYQNNVASDGVISANLELLIIRRWPVDVGVAVKGSFAFSGWNLGSPGVFDSTGTNYYYPDDVHISANWWAVAPMATLHVHVGPFFALDGAVGYGPYGYFNVSYWDDATVATGSVQQGSGFFPQNAWSLDWTAGLSFGFFRMVSVSLDGGMMGPDFIAGVGVNFLL